MHAFANACRRATPTSVATETSAGRGRGAVRGALRIWLVHAAWSASMKCLTRCRNGIPLLLVNDTALSSEDLMGR